MALLPSASPAASSASFGSRRVSHGTRPPHGARLVFPLIWTAIFKFKSRQTQFVLGRLNILLNLILLGLFIYRLFNLPAELLNFEKGSAMFLPIISVVLLALANKAIKKDEALIKSVDRLR